MSVDDAKFFESNDYHKYIDNVQKDYDEKIKDYAKKLKRYSNFRMLLTVLIPVVLMLDFYSKIIVMLISAAVTFFEYIVRFNMYDKKISRLNTASVDLTYEYSLYNDKVDIYNLDDEEKAFKLYVERTSKIIKQADMDTYNKFDFEAINEINRDTK